MTAAVVELDAARVRRRRQLVLRIDFLSAAGRRWAALGGGSTVSEAIESAREALPAGDWIAVAWTDLYGD